jgi:hypothetical protein
LQTFYDCNLPATTSLGEPVTICGGEWEALISPQEIESLCKGKGYIYITPSVMWNTAGTRIEYIINENLNDEYPAAPTTGGGEAVIVTNEVFKQGSFAHLIKSKDETKMIWIG